MATEAEYLNAIHYLNQIARLHFGELPPGEYFTATTNTADGGGQYWVTNKGGVYTTGNAQMQGAGSYLGLNESQRQGDRNFTGIELNANGGYTLVSQAGERYDFSPGQTAGAPTNPANLPVGQAPTPPVAPGGDDNASAKEIIRRAFADMGLEALADWAWGRHQAGLSLDAVVSEARGRDEYKARFPAMSELAKKGRAISEAQYIAYERGMTELFRAAGLPAGFYDQPTDFSGFLTNELSLQEVKDRVEMASAAAYSAPQETRDQLRDLYGITDGDLTAYWLDPERATPLLQKQFTAAELSGAASRTAFGGLSAAEGERLATLGVTSEEAEQQFSALASSEQLFAPTTGMEAGEQTIGRDEQLGAAFEGDAAARKKIEKQRRGRQATFEGGGSFATDNRGISGLGT